MNHDLHRVFSNQSHGECQSINQSLSSIDRIILALIPLAFNMGSTGIGHGGYDDEDEQRTAEECDSFTFMSCSDFASSSSLRFFSDCEGGGDSDPESYIEIELDHGEARLDGSDKGGGGGGGESDEEIELRLSISSMVPFPKPGLLSPQSQETGVDFSATDESAVLLSLGSSCADVGIGAQDLREEESGVSGNGGRGRTRGGGGAKFAAVCRLLSATVTSLKFSPETCREQDGDQQLPRLKEASKSTRTGNSARVMQFLFKFRAMQLRTFLPALMKNRPVLEKGKPLGESSRERRLEETLHFHHKMARSSRRKLAEIIASDKKTDSCPSSIKCSPINQGILSNNSRTHAGECSIQAAIAHCKESSTASNDFSFKPQC